MRIIPFQSFLASLASDGICMTIRDYRRIQLVLQTGGFWTFERLRDTLSALLAKDQYQQTIIWRRFEQFRELKPGEEKLFADINIQKALEDLQQLTQGCNISQKSNTHIKKMKEEPIQKKTNIKKSWLKIKLLVALSIVLIYAGVLAIQHFISTSPQPVIGLSTTKLNFSEKGTKEITINNRGSVPLHIEDIKISGPYADDFSLIGEYKNRTIAAGESYNISVKFFPVSNIEGSRIASLEIFYDASNSPQIINLKYSVSTYSISIDTRYAKVYDIEEIKNESLANVYDAKEFVYEPLEISEKCIYIVGIVLALAWFALCWFLYFWFISKISEDKSVEWDENKPSHFSVGSIGGKPVPSFDEETLSELADSMGYFQSEHAGKVLNLRASIEATVRCGGIPAIEFYKCKKVRSLLILADAYAEPTAWNPIAKELAMGMCCQGIPVLYGEFIDTPEVFRTEDNLKYYLDDFEDQRSGYLLLIFSDGRSFTERESDFFLEKISRWPMVAWLELREQRFWDETAKIPLRFGIPIYPATPEGIKKAVVRFLTEESPQDDFSENAKKAQESSSQANKTLKGYIEQLLGDALPWAQDCAMFQPVNLGLADALRREFHPVLSPGRIERLHRLPGTTRTVSGLRFSVEVLKILRTGFLVRRSVSEQEDVLRFLIKKIEEREPKEKDSLAYLKWEIKKERVRMELEQNNDLKRLAQLVETPLGDTIRAELENFGFQGEQDKVPLRIKPKNNHALQRLTQIVDNPEIPGFGMSSMPRWKWGLIVIFLFCLVVSFGGSFSISAYFFLSSNGSSIIRQETWEVVRRDGSEFVRLNDVPVLIEKWNGNEWLVEMSGRSNTLIQNTLTVNGKYRLTVYGGGHNKPSRDFTVKKDRMLQVVLAQKYIERPCSEEFPDINLIVEYCTLSEFGTTTGMLKSWQEKIGEKVPQDRLRSVGIEIGTRNLSSEDTSKLLSFRDTLLKTNSIDVLYRILPDNNGTWNIKETIQYIQDDLGPLINCSQLVWWTAGKIPEMLIFEDFLSKFDRSVNIGQGEDISWFTKLEEIFKPGENIFVTEAEILAVLDNTKARGNGEPILLIRPLSGFISSLKEKDVILRLSGSTTIVEELAPELAKTFLIDVLKATEVTTISERSDKKIIEGNIDGKKIGIEILAQRTSAGFIDLQNNRCDIVLASRSITKKEQEELPHLADMTSVISEHVIGLDVIAVIVNQGNPINQLSIKQISDIFSGKVSDWSQIGSHKGPIQVYAPNDMSETYSTFKRYVLDVKEESLVSTAKRTFSLSDLSSMVSEDLYSIGIVRRSFIGNCKAIVLFEQNTRTLAPSEFNIATRDYPLSSRLYFYTQLNQGNPLNMNFLNYALSFKGQKIVQESGFVPFFISKIDNNYMLQNNDYMEAVKNAKRLSINFYFRIGSYSLDNTAFYDMERLVKFLKNQSFKEIILIGFCDNTKGPYFSNINISLSLRRANEVKKKLQSKGIYTKYITLGMGEEVPFGFNPTARSQAKSRRVEVWVRE